MVCHYCGRQDTGTTRTIHQYDAMYPPACDDPSACMHRMMDAENDRQWEDA